MARDYRSEAAEAIGTFVMMLAGGLAILQGQGGLGIALAFGVAVAVMIYAVGGLSGAHFNPAITLAFAITRHFPWRRVPSYLAAQIAAAFAAIAVLAQIAPVDAVVASGTLHGAKALLVEVGATAFLAFVITATATGKGVPPAVPGLAIGAAVTLGAYVAGPLSGAAMNPARALAPAAWTGALDGLAATLVGPLLGATLGMACFEAVRRAAKPKAEAAETMSDQAEAMEAEA